MNKEKLKSELEWRGLLKDIANEENLEEIISSKFSFYIGIDPTADSMHIGHYMTISIARILGEYGLKPVFVIGGFTGAIGDPSGKDSEREQIDSETIKKNVSALTNQIKTIATNAGVKDFEIVDNVDFYNNMSITELYQKYGKHFNVNTMLGKEMVKNRLETGISYTEFSYQMFQAIDFLRLYEDKNVRLQIGGSDQWGNIASGLELIRKVIGPEAKASGITTNLLEDAEGNKIGKSEGKPIWLDASKTSDFEMHQYFINLNDNVALKLLSSLTSINEEEFKKVSEEHNNAPQNRIAQNELSRRMLEVIHGKDSFEKASKISGSVFSGDYSNMSPEQIDVAIKTIPRIEDNEPTLVESIIASGNLQSKREAREFIQTGALKVNGKSIQEDYKLVDADFIQDKAAIINVGKKKKFVVIK